MIKTFIDGSDRDIYNGHVHKIVFLSLLKQLLRFDISNRTEFDEVIALIMALVEIFADLQTAHLPKPTQPKSILPQYQIRMPT